MKILLLTQNHSREWSVPTGSTAGSGRLISTDGGTDGQTENTICRAAWSQLKTIGQLFYATSSFVHHYGAIGEFKLELQSGNDQSGSN